MSDEDQEQKTNKAVEFSPEKRFVRFRELLVRSTFTHTWKAHDNEEGMEVAWHVVSLGSLSEERREKTVSEIMMLKSLKQPNIIACHRSWYNRRKDEVVFITDNYDKGTTLRTYISRVKSDVRVRVMKKWCRQILLALHHMHSISPPAFHGALTWDCIFVNQSSGNVSICTPIAARQFSGEDLKHTQNFTSPAIGRGAAPSAESDLYSVGMCALAMVTSLPPFGADLDEDQVREKLMKGETPSLEEVSQPEMREIIEACVFASPGDTAAKLLLRFWGDEEKPESPSQSTTSTTSEVVVAKDKVAVSPNPVAETKTAVDDAGKDRDDAGKDQDDAGKDRDDAGKDQDDAGKDQASDEEAKTFVADDTGSVMSTDSRDSALPRRHTFANMRPYVPDDSRTLVDVTFPLPSRIRSPVDEPVDASPAVSDGEGQEMETVEEEETVVEEKIAADPTEASGGSNSVAEERDSPVETVNVSTVLGLSDVPSQQASVLALATGMDLTDDPSAYVVNVEAAPHSKESDEIVVSIEVVAPSGKGVEINFPFHHDEDTPEKVALEMMESDLIGQSEVRDLVAKEICVCLELHNDESTKKTICPHCGTFGPLAEKPSPRVVAEESRVDDDVPYDAPGDDDDDVLLDPVEGSLGDDSVNDTGLSIQQRVRLKREREAMKQNQ